MPESGNLLAQHPQHLKLLVANLRQLQMAEAPKILDAAAKLSANDPDQQATMGFFNTRCWRPQSGTTGAFGAHPA